MRRAILLAATVLCGAPATANAATLVKSGDTLTYNAAAGTQSIVTFAGSGATVTVTREAGDDDAITPTGCSAAGGGSFSCTGIARLTANAADGPDRLSVAGLHGVVPLLRGGDGNDYLEAGDDIATLEGGNGDDSLTGGAGASALRGDAGNDVLYGGAGSEFLDGGDGVDSLQGNGGADIYRGGAGVDEALLAVSVTGGPTIPLSVTLDGIANDGSPGEGDNVDIDVENVLASSVSVGGGVGSVTLIGNDGANRLEVSQGIATLNGGGGPDVLKGGAFDDTIEAADGAIDTVTCAGGFDRVHADAGDIVEADCEEVVRVQPPTATPTPTPTPASTPVAKKGVPQFTPYFATRVALQGSTLGRLDGIQKFGGLLTRSTVTVRCTVKCSRRVRVVRRAGTKPKRVSVSIGGGLVLRSQTRVEIRVSHAGRRTRYQRYRFVRRGGRLVAKSAGAGLLSG